MYVLGSMVLLTVEKHIGNRERDIGRNRFLNPLGIKSGSGGRGREISMHFHEWESVECKKSRRRRLGCDHHFERQARWCYCCSRKSQSSSGLRFRLSNRLEQKTGFTGSSKKENQLNTSDFSLFPVCARETSRMKTPFLLLFPILFHFARGQEGSMSILSMG